ncbi:putative magnesium transporter NIPA4, partial [Ananas comosus]
MAPGTAEAPAAGRREGQAAAGRGWVESYTGMSSDNIKGLVLALSSSFFIGASFIVKKKGLKKAGASGDITSYRYATVIVGKWLTLQLMHLLCYSANFYVTVLLLHISYYGRDYIYLAFWMCLCVWDQTTIVLHAPQEREIESVAELPSVCSNGIAAIFILIFHFIPQYGQTHIMVYVGVCSLVGSLSVMSVKALGIALKLTFSGMNQLIYPQTWAFTIVVFACVITQMNYLNK